MSDNGVRLHDIVEVKRVLSESQANTLLSKGWILLSIATGHEQTGQESNSPLFGYCLGKREDFGGAI
jgi:hypothetical protein